MTIAVIKRATGVVIKSGVNSAEVRRQAEIAEAAAAEAETNAAFAEEFSGPAYATQAAGEAATTEGQFFRVPIGTTPETYTRYQRTSGGSVEAAPLATTTDLAATDAGKGDALVGSDDGASGSLWLTVKGFISYLRTTGARIVGMPSGGTVEDAFNLRPEVKVYKLASRTLPSFVTAAMPNLRVWGVHKPGVNSVEHNAHLPHDFRARWASYMGGEDRNDIYDTWVDWENGDDSTGTGYPTAPYKTVAKAVLSGNGGTIWLLGDSQEILDLDGADRQVSSEPRAYQIRPAYKRATFYGPGDKASDATWTGPTAGSAYHFTPSTGDRRVEAIIYAPDQDWKNGLIVPFRGTGSDATDANNKATAAFGGWSQVGVTGAVYLKFRGGIDIEANKSDFLIVWAGQAATPHSLAGMRLLFDGIDFIGGDGFTFPSTTISSTDYESSVYLHDGGCWFSAESGLKPNNGATVIAQNWECSRNSGDGVGPYGSATFGFFDCKFNSNGDQTTYSGVTNADRNRQGLSTHENSKMFGFGGEAKFNYGQNIANTTSNASQEVSFILGVDAGHPGLAYPYSSPAVSPYTAVESYGVGYWGGVQVGGASANYGFIVGSGQAYVHRNLLHGTTGDGSGVGAGGQILYDPFGTLPGEA
jgi:hypothetical protein